MKMNVIIYFARLAKTNKVRMAVCRAFPVVFASLFKIELVKANLARYKNTSGKEINMSVVIVGGNECMVCAYQDICKKYGCKAKVFPKEKSSMKKKIGTPDLLILFTNTVSHKMMLSAMNEAKRCHIPIARIHTSSATALNAVLADQFGSI